ncbi:hypothetical protein OG535_29295 [Kitasatospora sp. NBC_00085]|uniref:hypothetical protein n=1 Tax=Kitasatospora sp. NBC_00085 TaxID=2903566 RepID=UPI00324B918E
MGDTIFTSNACVSLSRCTNLRITEAAGNEVDSFIEQESAMPRESGYDASVSAQRLLIAAAEFALIELIPDVCRFGLDSAREWLGGTLEVSENNVWEAELKSACHFGRWHPDETGLLNSRAALMSADVARILQIEEGQPGKPGMEQLLGMARALEKAHASHMAESFQAVAKSRIIRVQSVLWCAQLSLLGYPDFPISVDNAIEEACRIQDLYRR